MFWQLNLKNNQGAAAESQALKFLKRQGLRLIERNYACRAGELDLIMLHQSTLVFIEVRSRSTSGYGSAAETINLTKQNKIRKTAAHFLQSFPDHRHRLCRYDAILLNISNCNNDESNTNPIEWLQGAF